MCHTPTNEFPVGAEQLQEEHLFVKVLLQLLPDLCTHRCGLGRQEGQGTVKQLQATSVRLTARGREREGGRVEEERESQKERDRRRKRGREGERSTE